MADNDTKDPRDKQQQPNDQLVAMLGLLADDAQARGKKPDLKEIQDWHEGRLDSKRAKEVKSYVARDADCYRMWSELCAAEETATSEQEQPGPATRWLTIIKAGWNAIPRVWYYTGFATATVVMLAIILIPTGKDIWSPLDDPMLVTVEMNWPYSGMTVTRSGELDYRHKIALQSGMRKGFEVSTHESRGWIKAINSLPEKTVSCEKVSAVSQCEKQTQLMYTIGIHAAVSYLSCLDYESGQPVYVNEHNWEKQIDAWNMLSENLAKEKLKKPAALAKGIAIESDKTKQCSLVRDLIYMSY